MPIYFFSENVCKTFRELNVFFETFVEKCDKTRRECRRIWRDVGKTTQKI